MLSIMLIFEYIVTGRYWYITDKSSSTLTMLVIDAVLHREDLPFLGSFQSQ